MMYADSYMTRAEFRGMFDHRVYDQLRERLPLCLQAFPEVGVCVCVCASACKTKQNACCCGTRGRQGC